MSLKPQKTPLASFKMLSRIRRSFAESPGGVAAFLDFRHVSQEQQLGTVHMFHLTHRCRRPSGASSSRSPRPVPPYRSAYFRPLNTEMAKQIYLQNVGHCV
jgi:hypothetical protein